MTHKMHACDTEGGRAWVEAARAVHGWPHDKVALNVEYNKRTETTKHEVCPWGCGTTMDQYEDVPTQDAQLLMVNPRASGYSKSPQATTKAQNAELMKALANLTKEVQKLKAAQGGKA